MKKFLVILLICLSSLGLYSANAGDVKIAWTPSPSTGVTNYIVYASTNSINSSNVSSAQIQILAGPVVAHTLTNLTVGKWYITVTAVADDSESDISNVVTATIPAPAGPVIRTKNRP